MKRIIEDICQFSPRQGEGETRTAAYIEQSLREQNMNVVIEPYETIVPIIREARLHIGETVYEAPYIVGCCFESGSIGGRIAFENHTQPSPISGSMFDSVIAHNPHCAAPSQASFYRIPAVAVTKRIFDYANKAYCAGKAIKGFVEVEQRKHGSKNILLGNISSPRVLCITHYDCLQKGALDNASGVAVLLHAIEQIREKTDDILFAFCGNEEICAEPGYYGGKGYRVLYEAHEKIFEDAQKIVVVDSVGNSAPRVLSATEDSTCYSGFPVPQFEVIRNKLSLIMGEMQGLLDIYHSEDDDGRNITEEHLQETATSVREFLEV